MKKFLYKRRTHVMLFALLSIFILPFTAKSQPDDCIYRTLPFVELFDHTPGGTTTNGLLPSCWKKNNSASKPYIQTQSTSSSNFVTAYGVLNMNSSNSTTNMAILPGIDIPGLTMQDLQVNFMFKTNNNVAGGLFIIGVMEDPEVESSFMPIDTIVASASTTTAWKQHSIPLINYTGTGNYIAFIWKSGGTNQVFIDNLYIDIFSNCSQPTSLAIDSVSDKTVYFSWLDGNSTSWDVVCAPYGEAPDWNYAFAVTGNSANISGLDHTSKYALYLRAVCGNYRSVPLIIPFQTACGITTADMLPYSESFDSYGTGTGTYPTCWSRITPAYSSLSIATTYRSAPGALYMSAGSDPLYAITGQLDMDISKLQLNFEARASIDKCNFVVGTMTDPLDAKTFTPIDTILIPKASNWYDCKVSFDKYDQGGQYIAIRHGVFNSSFPNLYIDNFVINTLVSCIAPSNVNLLTVTESEALLSWTPNGSETKWEIVCGHVGFDPDNDIVISVIDSSKNTIITGLTGNTRYEIYVRALCNDENMSPWAKLPQSFQTLQTPTTLPYECDFEDDENDNWTLKNGNQTNKWCIDAAVNNTFVGLKSLYISNTNGETNAYNNASSATSYVYAYRRLTFTTTGEYRAMFDWRAHGNATTDLLRAFLVPTTANLEAGSVNGMGGSSNTTPSGWIDLGGGQLFGNNEWTTTSTEFVITSAREYHLVFFWKNSANGLGEQSPAAVDNISIFLRNCPAPYDLTVKDINDTEAAITWKERGTATQWEVQYGPQGFTLGTGMVDYTNDTDHVLTNLLPDYISYQVYVRSICAVGDTSSWVGPISFITLQTPTPLPYRCDFEDDDENSKWILLNGNRVNKWYIGTANNNTSSGDKALYISDSNGVTHNYTPDSSSYVYAMRAVHFASEGVYEIEFDWQAQGYASYDLLRAFLVPSTYPIVEGSTHGMSGANNSKPTEWIDIGGGVLSQQKTWQYHNITVNIAEPKTYHLVFFWKNYTYKAGIQPPGIVDNIKIKRQTCNYPFNVQVQNISNTGVTVSWSDINNDSDWEVQYGTAGFILGTGTSISTMNTQYTMNDLLPDTQYDVYVRTICNVGDASIWSPKCTFKTHCPPGITQLPYFENFDTYNSGTAIQSTRRDVHPYCWVMSKSVSSFDYPYLSSAEEYVHSAPHSLNFGYTHAGQTMAILPAIAHDISVSDLQISFWGRARNGSSGTFQVGITETPLTETSFVMINEIVAPTDEYQQYTFSFEDYTSLGKYIAFKWSNGSNNSFSIDDIEITYNSNFVCTPPTALTVTNITENTAMVTWSAGANENTWAVEYKRISDTEYGEPQIVNTTHYTVTDLEANVDYNVRVRAVCDITHNSSAIMTSFKTLIPATPTYTIVATAGPNGTISPSDTIVNQGDSVLFTFTPDNNYSVSRVLVNDDSVGNGTSYTITNVMEDMTIHVEFVGDSTGIQQHHLDNSVLIYPNPASAQLKVELSASFEQLEITNLLGQVVYTANVSDNEFTINVGGYRAGVYFIRLSGTQGVATKRFVKGER